MGGAGQGNQVAEDRKLLEGPGHWSGRLGFQSNCLSESIPAKGQASIIRIALPGLDPMGWLPVLNTRRWGALTAAEAWDRSTQ